jgi:hypothetical protein
MPGTRLNKKITALYGSFAAAALGASVFFYSEAVEAKQKAQLESLFDEAQLLDISTYDILDEAKSKKDFDYFFKSVLLKHVSNPSTPRPDYFSLEPGPQRICAHLRWTEEIAQNYIEEAPDVEIRRLISKREGFSTAAYDDSPAEKALCPK